MPYNPGIMAGRRPNEAIEAQFAQLLAKGHTQSDAFRFTHPNSKDWEPKSVWVEASKLANRPSVKQRVRDLLDASDLSALDSIPRWYARLMDMYEKAMEAKNYTAAGNALRQMGQALGSLRDKVEISGPELTDEQLVGKLSQGNPEAAAMLHKIIGKDSFDA